VSYVEPERQTLLMLDWNGVRIALDERRQALACGTSPGLDLRIQRPCVSRRHARIERRGDAFVLVDESTNGTFVQTEDRRVAFVRRGEVRLWGEGWLSFGEPPGPASVVRFRHD
jgi:pSer/pThr/pTyr-binding forkhead associated (FHA) protein